MNTDERIKEQVTIIKVLCSEWLKYVDDLGNQCPYTDKVLEEIIAAGIKMEMIYNGK